MNKLLVLFLIFCTFSFSSAVAVDVKLMEKEELQGLLGAKDLVLLDVRTGMDWSTSELKIKGAMRADGAAFNSWAEKYPKNGKVVLYCA